MQDKMVHKQSICLVKWSPNAGRIVSADLAGHVGVWKLSSQKWLQQMCKISVTQSAVTHLVFRTHDQRPGAMGLEAPSFYFASEDGAVFFSGDDGMVCTRCSAEPQAATTLRRNRKCRMNAVALRV